MFLDYILIETSSLFSLCGMYLLVYRLYDHDRCGKHLIQCVSVNDSLHIVDVWWQCLLITSSNSSAIEKLEIAMFVVLYVEAGTMEKSPKLASME